MGEVSLEFIVELLKRLDARLDRLDERMDSLERVVLDLHREVADLKTEVHLLRSDNLAFRGYLDALTRDNHRNFLTAERTRQDIAEMRARLERVEARPEPA